MGISTVVGPTFEPVSLEEARLQVRVTNDAEDGILAGYILAARMSAEASIRRVLTEQTFDFTVDFAWPIKRVATPYGHEYWRTRLELPLSPVLAPASVSSVAYVDSDGAIQTLDPSQYVVVTDGAVAYIEPAYSVIWPVTRWQPQAITVRFKAGYQRASDTPEPVRQAILMLVAHFYANREGTSTPTLSEVPFGIEALLSQYRQSRILS